MDTTAFDRQVAGYTYARNNIEKITAGLDKNTDGIYFVSHSMGAAFAFGMEIYLISQGWHVRSSVFLNAYQAMSMNVSHKYDNYVIHVDYQNTNDPVLNYADYNAPITGNIDLRIRYEAPTSWESAHRYPIDIGNRFWDDLKRGKNGNYQYFKSFLKTKTW